MSGSSGDPTTAHLLPSLDRLPVVTYAMSDEDDPVLLAVTGATERIIGWSSEACVGIRPLRIPQVHAADRMRMRASWREVRGSGSSVLRELFRVTRPGGDVVWVQNEATRVSDPETGVPCWQGVLVDVTERVDREDALESSGERYRSLVEHLPAILYRVAPDDDRHALFVSPQIELSLGYSLEEWLDQNDIWAELLHPEDREPTLAAWDEANYSGERFERRYRLIASDGTARWFHDVAVLIRDETGTPLFWEGLQIDATEQHRLEEDLRDATFFLEERVRERTSTLEEANAVLELETEERRLAEARYQRLVTAVPAWLYTWKIVDGLATGGFTSPQAQNDFGYDLVQAEQLGESYWRRFVHPDDVARVWAMIDRSAQTGVPFEQVYRWITPSGRSYRVLDRARPAWFDPETRWGEFVGVMMDISLLDEPSGPPEGPSSTPEASGT